MKRARLIRCVEWGIAEETVYGDGSGVLDCRLLKGACRGLECTIPDALGALVKNPEKRLAAVPKGTVWLRAWYDRGNPVKRFSLDIYLEVEDNLGGQECER